MSKTGLESMVSGRDPLSPMARTLATSVIQQIAAAEEQLARQRIDDNLDTLKRALNRLDDTPRLGGKEYMSNVLAVVTYARAATNHIK